MISLPPCLPNLTPTREQCRHLRLQILTEVRSMLCCPILTTLTIPSALKMRAQKVILKLTPSPLNWKKNHWKVYFNKKFDVLTWHFNVCVFIRIQVIISLLGSFIWSKTLYRIGSGSWFPADRNHCMSTTNGRSWMWSDSNCLSWWATKTPRTNCSQSSTPMTLKRCKLIQR